MLDNAHALLIGIAAYRHIKKLSTTVINDVKDIRALLVDPLHCGYPPENVRLLTDDEATRRAIQDEFAALAGRCDKDSILFIYISSHGGQIESGLAAGEYLLPVDAEVDFAAAPPQIAAASAISGTEFTEALRAVAARKVLILFDCCHAGGIGQPKDGAAAAFRAGLPDSYYDRLKSGRGRAILASSRDSESSYILAGDRNSLFTKHLLAGLRGGINSADGLITVFDLFEYVQPRVTTAYPAQHPIFKAELEQNFPVALRLGGEKSPAPEVDGGYLYDVYISYASEYTQDSDWVWETLWPRLEAAGLKVAISDDVARQGVARVVSIERGITRSKRTLVLLSPHYMQNRMAQFENVMAQSLSVAEGAARLITVILDPFDTSLLPYRLSPAMVKPADLSQSGARARRQFARLVETLQGPLQPLF